MDGRDCSKFIEAIVDWTAASALAVSVGFAMIAFGGSPANAAAAAALALLAALWLLRRVESSRRLQLPAFGPARLPAEEDADELLLTGEMRLVRATGEDELLLDDILASIGPHSRVVRLFEKPSLPTAGELKASIDRHLGRAVGATSQPDASQALHDALAELRKSLR